MFRNYLTIALRNLSKHTGYSLINILGLAVGMMCFILISLFVRIELSYDRFHEKADRIFRVVKEDPGNFYLGNNHYAVTPIPLAPALAAEFPAIEIVTRIDNVTELISKDDLKVYEDGMWGDEHFFDVFSYQLVSGDPRTALKEPNTIVLSRSMAARFFGDSDPMGQTLLFRNEKTLRVTGLLEDPPENAHFTFNYLVSFPTSENFVRNQDIWDSNSWYTYFVLRAGHSIEEVESGLPAFTKTHLADSFTRRPERMSRFYVQPLTDIHLFSHINFDLDRSGDIKYVYMFSCVALVILLIACINYMNLATARSAARFREVGVRKVVGAVRGQLMVQFIGESVVLSLIAVALASILVALLLPTFNTLVERAISLDFSKDGLLMIGLVCVGVGVGVVSGSYPAVILSGARPAVIIRQSNRSGSRKAWLRNTLVVGQFAATIMLIAGTLVIDGQLDYMRTTDIGVDRDHVVVIDVEDAETRKQYESIRGEFMSHRNIIMTTTSSSMPTRISSQTALSDWDGRSDDTRVPIYTASVNYDYVEMFGLDVVEGRGFSREFPSDSKGALMLNETAVEQIGWESAVGKTIKFWGSENDRGTVVGVLKDYHMHSFHQEIEPLMLYMRPDRFSRILVKIEPHDIPETIAFMEEKMKGFSPDYPFTYEFLDDAFNRMYKTEQTLSRVFTYFTGIGLVIACLGLFGLAAFMAEQRTREIGVRKVLGASLSNIMWIMSRDFAYLIIIAFAIAVPVSFYAMEQWLDAFAYRIELGAGIFLLSGFGAFLIAWCTVSWQSLRAARANPAESLQYE
ncbi:MAG: FtsX-like permease family protein [Candidatus Latescibacteria bacterium]|jgi:putative ABC transport system permease protein|nr:FtsX-like permease family protein [Candidatus Latescibacterota bacterium]